VAAVRRKSAGPGELGDVWGKIKLVAEISSRLREEPASREVYVAALEVLRKIVPFDAATLYVVDPDSERLAEKAVVGGGVEPLGFLRLGTGGGLSGWAARNKKPVLLADRSNKSDFDPDSDLASVMSVPLLAGDEVCGVLNLGSRRARAFDERHLDVIAVVADQLSIGFERLARQEMMEARKRELDEAGQWRNERQAAAAAEERLRAAVDRSHSVHHDVNNSLAVIVGNVECLLVKERTQDQKTLSRLRRIEAAALRISETNRRLLETDIQRQGNRE